MTLYKFKATYYIGFKATMDIYVVAENKSDAKYKAYSKFISCYECNKLNDFKLILASEEVANETNILDKVLIL